MALQPDSLSNLSGLPETPVRRLRRLWREGAAPDIRAFLLDNPPADNDELVGLLEIDLQERLGAGHAVSAEEYFESFPQLSADSETALVLVYGEFVHRERMGGEPQAEEYLRRFPALAERLKQQFELRDALGPAPAVDEGPFHSLFEGIAKTTPSRRGIAGLPDIDGFEIIAELGRGGMGVVYQAWQTSLGRMAAIKMILSGDHAGEDDLSRFRTEAEAVARLAHPNIVSVHLVGEHQGRPFLALEYLDGGSLADRLDGTPMSPKPAAELMRTLAGAVHFAHTKGIVHRDLKPANVLMAADGTPKIADFGLAKLVVGGPADRTRTGLALGTPSYMSPEQTGGRSADVGPGADVYALGAMLYEMLTGRPPFRTQSAVETMVLVRSEDPVPPRKLVPRIPRDLETICLKCLEKSPARRFATAAELADDLRRFLAGEPISARPVSAAVAGLAAATTFIAATAIAAVVVLWLRAEREADDARSARVEVEVALDDTKRQRLLAESESVRARAAEILAADRAKSEAQRRREADDARDEAESMLYVHGIALAEREWVAGDADRARAALAGCPTRLADWEHSRLRRLFRSELFAAGTDNDTLRCVAFDPKGRWYAAGGHDFVVTLRDANTGEVARVMRGLGPVASIAFSDDGVLIAAAYSDGTLGAGVSVRRTADGREMLLRRWETTSVNTIAFAGDGKSLAAAGSDKVVRLWNLTTDRIDAELVGHEAGVVGVAMHPDGRHAASLDSNGQVVVWDLHAKSSIRRLTAHTIAGDSRVVGGIAYSRDGSLLAATGYDRTVVVWDAATGRERVTISGHSDRVTSVAFAPRGDRLVSTSWDRTVRVWDLAAATSGRLDGVMFSRDGRMLVSADWSRNPGESPVVRMSFALRGHSQHVWSAALSPDGSRIVSVGGRAGRPGELRVWDATGAPDCRVLAGHPFGTLALAFSPDGKVLASSGRNGEVCLWDPSGSRIRMLDAHSRSSRRSSGALAFSPDGLLLASGGSDQTVRLHDPATGRELRVLEGLGGTVTAVVFTPDSKRVIAVGGSIKPDDPGAIRIWDTASGDLVAQRAAHTGRILCATLVPGSNQLITGGADGLVMVHDAETGAEVARLAGHEGAVVAVAVAADGKWIAGAGGDLRRMDQPGAIRLWQWPSGRLRHVLRGHEGPVLSLAFRPVGRRLASTGSDATVRLWDPETGREVLALRGLDDRGNAIVFDPEGGLAAAADDRGFIRVWDGRVK